MTAGYSKLTQPRISQSKRLAVELNLAEFSVSGTTRSSSPWIRRAGTRAFARTLVFQDGLHAAEIRSVSFAFIMPPQSQPVRVARALRGVAASIEPGYSRPMHDSEHR